MRWTGWLWVALALGCRGQPAGEPPPPSRLQGTVLEILDASVYTYLRLGTPGGEVWAATAWAAVEEGEQVTLDVSTVQHDFHSQALQRRFERLHFGVLRRPKPADGRPNRPAGHLADPAGSPPAASGAREEHVYSVLEVQAQAAALEGRKVVVRGTVTQVSRGVLGRNWLQLRDGGGPPEEQGSHLTVTTRLGPTVGDVLLLEGTVRRNPDFGVAQSVPLLLEDAVLLGD
jgi:hypothetical protein